MNIQRKGFLKLAGLLGTGALLPEFARAAALKPREEEPLLNGEESFSHTFCGLCPAGCGVRVRKVDGVAVGVSGALDHPINLGSLCPKGAAGLQELYHPDRLKSPLARREGRGKGEWTEISWEDALGRIGDALGRGKAGPGTPLAALGAAAARDIDSELLRQLAASAGSDNYFTLGFPANEPPSDAYRLMNGSAALSCDLAKPRLLVSFSWDWLAAHPSHVEAQRAFAQLRRRGGERAYLVQAEPRFSVSAAKADSWLPIRPGTQGLLALCAAREIIANGRHDAAFLRDRSLGFEGFAKALEPFSIRRVSKAAGIPERDIRLLCVKLMGMKPALAVTGRGALFDQLAVHALNAVLGALGEEGLFSSWREESGQAGAQEAPRKAPGMLLVDRVNPIFTAPDAWRPVFEKTPWVVTVSPFLTETAEYSDLVLPCLTPLERPHASLHRMMDGRPILNAAPRAVEPLPGAKGPGEIFLLIAKAIGLQGQDAADFDSRLKAKTAAMGADDLLQEGSALRWRELPRPEGKLSFTTPSGKFELGPLTKLLEDPGSMLLVRTEDDFPLSLYVFVPLPFSHGEGGHLPFLQSVPGVQSHEMWGSWAEVHTETAKKYSISNGDDIRVLSRKGSIRLKARVLPTAVPGVVSVPFGFGHSAYGRWAKGVGADPLAAAESLAGTRVRIERA